LKYWAPMESLFPDAVDFDVSIQRFLENIEFRLSKKLPIRGNLNNNNSTNNSTNNSNDNNNNNNNDSFKKPNKVSTTTTTSNQQNQTTIIPLSSFAKTIGGLLDRAVPKYKGLFDYAFFHSYFEWTRANKDSFLSGYDFNSEEMKLELKETEKISIQIMKDLFEYSKNIKKENN